MSGDKEEPNLLFYAITGTPRYVSKFGFIWQAVFFFSVFIASLVLAPLVLVLITFPFYLALFLFWWGIGRYNINRQKYKSKQ